MKSKFMISFLFIPIFIFCTMAVQAATLDFSVLPSGDTGQTVLSIGNSLINVPGGTVYIFRPGDSGAFPTSGGVCALNGSGNCETDWTLTFNQYAVTNLVFESAFYDTGDTVQVKYFDGVTLLGSISVTGNGVINLSSIARITSLEFDDSSTGAGFGFGEFSFDKASQVPEPATMLLLGLGLMGLAGIRRKIQK